MLIEGNNMQNDEGDNINNSNVDNNISGNENARSIFDVFVQCMYRICCLKRRNYNKIENDCCEEDSNHNFDEGSNRHYNPNEVDENLSRNVITSQSSRETPDEGNNDFRDPNAFYFQTHVLMSAIDNIRSQSSHENSDERSNNFRHNEFYYQTHINLRVNDITTPQSSFENSDEESNDFYHHNVLHPDKTNEDLSMKIITPQFSSKNSNNENDGNTVTCHNPPLSHKDDESSSEWFIESQITESVSSLTCEVIGESSSENLDNENASYLNILAELFTSDEDDAVEIRHDDDEDIIYSDSWIREILSSLMKGVKHNCVWSSNIYDQLSILLERSVHKKVKLFLLENNFLHVAKTILRTCNKPWMIIIIIDIIINICCNDKVIDFIGNDKNLVTVILNHFKYYDNIVVPRKLLELLLLIVYRIQKNPQSPWTSHLNYEYIFMETTIIEMLKNTCNDDLLMAEHLLQFIIQINSLHINFLQQVFKLNKLISGLLTCFIQVIPEKKDKSIYSIRELAFIKTWLTLMITIRQRILFKNYNNKIFLKFMDIMYSILKQYNKIQVLALKLDATEITQNIFVIHRSVCLLASVHYSNIPNRIEAILINIFCFLKTADFKTEVSESLEKEMKELSQHLFQYWKRFVKNYNHVQIYKLLNLYKPEIRIYLLNLIRSDSNISFEILQKVQKVEHLFLFTSRVTKNKS